MRHAIYAYVRHAISVYVCHAKSECVTPRYLWIVTSRMHAACHMPHMNVLHPVNGSRHVWMLHATYEWVTSHIRETSRDLKKYTQHTRWPWLKVAWHMIKVMSHLTWLNHMWHVTRLNYLWRDSESRSPFHSCVTYDRVMSQTNSAVRSFISSKRTRHTRWPWLRLTSHVI